MAETVTIDKDAAREMLNMANIAARQQIAHPEWWQYVQRILGPAVFGKDWKGDGS